MFAHVFTAEKGYMKRKPHKQRGGNFCNSR